VAEAKYHAEDLLVFDLDYEQNLRVRRRSHTFSVRQPRLYSPICDPALAG
jgi:hypothetical protein